VTSILKLGQFDLFAHLVPLYAAGYFSIIQLGCIQIYRDFAQLRKNSQGSIGIEVSQFVYAIEKISA